MKWYAYCMTCNANLTAIDSLRSALLRESNAEKLAEQHMEKYHKHHVLIGYYYQPAGPEPEITFNDKGDAYHG